MKENLMKSIDIYRRKKNNREKGGDGSDAAITAQPSSNVHTYTACCFLLWGTYHRHKWKNPNDHRVYDKGQAKTICVELVGIDKKDALSKLNTNAYEFIEWWG